MEDDLKDIKSDEVSDILSKVPNWVLKYGMTTFAGTFVMIFIVAAVIRYPDVLKAKTVVTTENPPVPLVAKSGGPISKLFFDEGEMVHSYSDVAVIESPASYQDVKNLQYQLKYIQENYHSDEMLSKIKFGDYRLGSIQASFTYFVRALKDFTSFRQIDYHASQVGSFEMQKEKFGSYVSQVHKQEQALSAELELMRKRYSTDSLLATSGAKTRFEVEESKRMLLQKMSAYYGVNSVLVQTQIRLSELDKSITDTELDFRKKQVEIETDFHNAMENLNSDIKLWYQNYVLTSPIPGVVSFSEFWTENLTVAPDQEVFVISPKIPGAIYASVFLPIQGSAKVKIGQKVVVKLINYPAEEYGFLIGEVERVSPVPNNGNYLVKVKLPDGLTTSYGMKLEFRQQMEGVAEIITKDRSVISRIFSKLKLVVEEH